MPDASGERAVTLAEVGPLPAQILAYANTEIFPAAPSAPVDPSAG